MRWKVRWARDIEQFHSKECSLHWNMSELQVLAPGALEGVIETKFLLLIVGFPFPGIGEQLMKRGCIKTIAVFKCLK